jgi:hypothetical protein
MLWGHVEWSGIVTVLLMVCAAVYGELGLDTVDSAVGCFLQHHHIMASSNSSDESSTSLFTNSKTCGQRQASRSLSELSTKCRKACSSKITNDSSVPICAGYCALDSTIRVISTKKCASEMKTTGTDVYCDDGQVSGEMIGVDGNCFADGTLCNCCGGMYVQTPYCLVMRISQICVGKLQIGCVKSHAFLHALSDEHKVMKHNAGRIRNTRPIEHPAKKDSILGRWLHLHAGWDGATENKKMKALQLQDLELDENLQLPSDDIFLKLTPLKQTPSGKSFSATSEPKSRSAPSSCHTFHMAQQIQKSGVCCPVS